MQAVMMYAKACDKLPLQQCQSNASAMLEEMRNISFVGKSGLVKLDGNDDRIPGSVAFKNYWLNPSVFFDCCLYYPGLVLRSNDEYRCLERRTQTRREDDSRPAGSFQRRTT